MLTAVEINDLWNQSKNPDDFARAIERAVMKKLGEQEPAWYKEIGAMEIEHPSRYRKLVDVGSISWLEYEPLYARPLPAQAQAVPEWTDEQCSQFISVAMRHVDIIGSFTWDDIRAGCHFANKLSAAPKP